MLINANALAIPLAAKSVHTIVTSPPYYGLRDYGTAKWEGGIVFDPFVGSGTTVATAIQLGRKGIGIDLSFKYLQENAKVRVESAEAGIKR